jgi:tetratricopeptide (TPR) repeat protein/O-antigen ligase
LQRRSFTTRWADRIIEGGWLLALVFTPYFFSLLTARHFEPDKAMVLRTLVLVMLAAWGIKTVERVVMLRERINWRAWWRAPLAIPALLFAGVFVLATLTSVQPTTSWWGFYQRGQGTYTNLSYIAMFALIVGNLRTRDQLERLLTTVILTGVSVSIYGMIQHFGLDPLPWRGNVITRISSTMGNSIFVAAYLIMVVPWALYRLVMAIANYRSAPTRDSVADWTWLGFTALLLFGQQALLLGILKFMGAVRPSTGDFRYWWVFPVALALVAATFTLVNAGHTLQPKKKFIGILLAGFAAWGLLFLLVYTGSSGSQFVDHDNPLVSDWWLWLLLGWSSITGFLLAGFFLPRRGTLHTRIWELGQIAGTSTAIMLILLAIFFSQSRGPWIGGMVGIGLFIVLLLLRLLWTGRQERWDSVGQLRMALWSILGLGVLGAAFLITFNLSQAPIFERLREVSYIGRLGRLLETDDGTGRVRLLIWAGDEHGGGVLGLLNSNPLRTFTLGHGPETMFTVFNPHYPPELAQYEQRGASPDRSHQAWLDELVTKGVLGLLSYFFLFGSAFWLAWQQIRRSPHFQFQVLAIAALAAIAAHFVEVLVGIPIVSTLTMLWASFGILVVGGVLSDLYTLDGRSPADAQTSMEVVPTADERSRRTTGRGRANREGRGVGERGAAAAGTSVGGVGLRWMYPLILGTSLALGWFWNLRVNYADMFLNQAQSITTRTLQEEAVAYQKVLRAVELAPREDYYHLQLGNALLKLVVPYKLSAQQTFDERTAPRPNQRFEDLFVGGSNERVVRLVQSNSVEQMLEYARIVLERAAQLNPGNKDHSANLGRLHSMWARRAGGGAEHYSQAIEAFERAHRIAPNDVVILNELASNLALAGDVAAAEARFQESLELDPTNAETYARLGEIYRVAGRIEEAAELYADAVRRNRNIFDTDQRQLGPILASLEGHPGAIATLLDAYEEQKNRYDEQIQRAVAEDHEPPIDTRFLSQLAQVRAAAGDAAGMQTAFSQALQLDGNNVRIHQQYTLALSNTRQFDAALQQAQEGLELAQAQGLEREVADLQQLMDMIRAKAGGQ